MGWNKISFEIAKSVLFAYAVKNWLVKSLGFPDSSVGKESICSAGDPGSIPGSGRSGEGIGYPLQYSWASLVAQLVKNLPAMQEAWIQSLGWEDPLGKGKATHSRTLAWKIPWTTQSMGSQRVTHNWATVTKLVKKYIPRENLKLTLIMSLRYTAHLAWNFSLEVIFNRISSQGEKRGAKRHFKSQSETMTSLSVQVYMCVSICVFVFR